MTRAGLGLGSNLGGRASNLKRAIAAVDKLAKTRCLAVSNFYESLPWGRSDQPLFLNACAVIETDLVPHDLLDAVKVIERRLGRIPGPRWGPRLIDIDILFYGDITCDTLDLTLPHKHLFVRAFALLPLAEIAPDQIVGGVHLATAATEFAASGHLTKVSGANSWCPKSTRS